MKCECGCGEEAENVMETQASGVSLLCESCSDALFIALMSKQLPVIEHERQA